MVSESRRRSKLKKFLVKDLKNVMKAEGLGKAGKKKKSELINIIIASNVSLEPYKTSKVKREVSEERKEKLREQLKKARAFKTSKKTGELPTISELVEVDEMAEKREKDLQTLKKKMNEDVKDELEEQREEMAEKLKNIKLKMSKKKKSKSRVK